MLTTNAGREAAASDIYSNTEGFTGSGVVPSVPEHQPACLPYQCQLINTLWELEQQKREPQNWLAIYSQQKMPYTTHKDGYPSENQRGEPLGPEHSQVGLHPKLTPAT